VIPGVLLGLLFCAFIVLCAVIKPSCAPNFRTEATPLSMKLYMLFDILVMAMVMAWPQIALWLPRMLGE